MSARNLNSEATKDRFGLQHHRKKNKVIQVHEHFILRYEFTELVWIVHIFKLNFEYRSCSVVSNCTSRVVLLINKVMINLIFSEKQGLLHRVLHLFPGKQFVSIWLGSQIRIRA